MQGKTSQRRVVGMAAAAVAAALVFSGCAAVEGDVGGGSELPVVTFGATQDPSSIGTVAHVINARNLDEECGITIDPLRFSPDAAEVALLSGQTDVGYFGYNSWASSPEKLDKLTMLAPLQAEHGTLFVPENSSVRSVADLQGRRIALLPPVSAQYQDFNMLLAHMGFSLAEDFDAVTAPPPAIEAFLRRGEVDAAILFEPNATNLLQAGGFRPLFRLNDKWQELTGSPLYMLGISANSAWLAGHETEAECAVQAVRRATEILANDPSIYDELRDVLGAAGDDHLAQLSENLGSIYTPESAQEAEPAIRAQLEQAQSLGLIPAVPDTIFTPIGGDR